MAGACTVIVCVPGTGPACTLPKDLVRAGARVRVRVRVRGEFVF